MRRGCTGCCRCISRWSRLPYCRSRPFPIQIGTHAHRVKMRGDFIPVHRLLDEPVVGKTNNPDFALWSRHQNNTIRLQTLVFPPLQLALHNAMLVDEHTAQSIASWAALPKTQFDQPTLARKYLRRKLAAIFTGHRTLDSLNYGRDPSRSA